MTELPITAGALGNLRVIDVSKLWAGPSLTELLANLGAEVIKVEAVQSPDLWRSGGARLSVDGAGAKPGHELSPIFNAVNRNKLGVTLDLTRAAGQDLLKRLVAIGDVVVENYSPRVMAKFGLDYPALRAVNDRVIMISLPAYGMTGPWRDFVGFAYPTEESTGFPHFTGYADGPPMLWGPAGADSFAGITGAVAVAAALVQRERTGTGQYIDLSQVEALTTWLGPQMIDYCWNGTPAARYGNRSPRLAPHGCYPAAGDDWWVVVAVEDDRQWQALCEVLGRGDWAVRGDLATAAGRQACQDELDHGISCWTADLDHREAALTLQRAGVAAAPVLKGDELIRDPHLLAREFIEWHDRAWVGSRAHTGMWAKLSGTPGTIRFPAPLLGEHNDHVLRGLLGLGQDEMADLERSEIIGTAPVVRVAF
jgi:crotonobetainyl-CoA:carnitine CoA-transferase CaiB-like acyl-CoA transferase